MRPGSVLEELEIFSGLSSAGLESLLEYGRLETLADGSVLLRQGASADKVYILLSGEVQVRVRMPDGVEHTVTRLGPGGMIGESVLARSVGFHTASAVASGPVDVMVFTDTALDVLANERPSVYIALLQGFIRISLARVERLSQMYAKTRTALERFAEV